MRIDGEWFECDDGFVRPVVRGEIQNARGKWEPAPFLVDTGADCTVFSASVLQLLGFDPTKSDDQLGGVGGISDSVSLVTQIRFPRNDGGLASFRGEFAAFTKLEALDMCVLGRDILDLFAVIVDRPNDAVMLLRPPHEYLLAPST